MLRLVAITYSTACKIYSCKSNLFKVNEGMRMKKKETYKPKYFSNTLQQILTVFSLIFGLTNCGQSGNSRVLVRDSNIETEADQGADTTKKCLKGCFGVPQSWFEAGIIVDTNKKIVSFNPATNAYGPCYFLVCPDINDPFHKGAKEYVEAFTGGIFEDPGKCASSMSLITNAEMENQLGIMSTAQSEINDFPTPQCF